MSAACVGYPIDLFFPEPRSGSRADFETPLAVCRQCPVIVACRREAEAAGDIQDGHTVRDHGGVVGGCAPKQRKSYYTPKVRRAS